MLIAVVDDHKATRVEMCRLLDRQGYATCHFSSVAEFIRSNEISKIDCLLSDVRMPEIDGISLQACLKNTNLQFPVIFCTGGEIDERLKGALANGVFALLRKPVSSDRLLETIEAACASSRPASDPRPSR